MGRPVDIDNAFWLSTQTLAMLYARSRRRDAMRSFKTRRTLLFFDMSSRNLYNLCLRFPDNQLHFAVAHVTGVGLPTAQPYSRFPPQQRFSKRRHTTLTEVYATNYVENGNRIQGLYANRYLAKALRLVLEPLGFAGWIYPRKSEPEMNSNPLLGDPLNPEVMVWGMSDKLVET